MTSHQRLVSALRTLLAAAALAGPPAIACAHQSLYAAMGGTKVVARFVSQTIDKVAADPRLNQSFRDVDLARVKRELTSYICQLAGGGCKYTGIPIRAVHANLGITQAQFYGLVQILRHQMRVNHVDLRDRNRLLALLAPLEPQVVDVRVPPPKRKD